VIQLVDGGTTQVNRCDFVRSRKLYPIGSLRPISSINIAQFGRSLAIHGFHSKAALATMSDSIGFQLTLLAMVLLIWAGITYCGWISYVPLHIYTGEA
jgi:hypothetical protein